MYLAHYYPPAPQRFLADEVIRWKKAGLDIAVVAIREPSVDQERLMPSDVREEIASTIYLRQEILGAFARGASIFLSHPLSALAALLFVVRSPYKKVSSWRLRAHSLLTYLRAVSVAGLAARQSTGHIHCDFSDDTATIALILKRVMGVSFSFRDYFSFNPQAIEEKVDEARFVLACSGENKASLERDSPGAEPAKIVVDFLGVDLERWLPTPVPVSDTVVSVGRLQEKKGHRHLVNAMAVLRARGCAARCVLVGDGELRDELQTQIETLGLSEVVRITGYVDRETVQGLIQESRVSCLPAVRAQNGDTDGIPFVLMEAMAMGRPVVATPIGGIQELISDGGDGYLVAPGDAEQLANALELLLLDGDLAATLGHAARRKAEALLDIEANTVRTAHMLRSVCR